MTSKPRITRSLDKCDTARRMIMRASNSIRIHAHAEVTAPQREAIRESRLMLSDAYTDEEFTEALTAAAAALDAVTSAVEYTEAYEPVWDAVGAVRAAQGAIRTR